jgi:hypothetical protein
VEEIIELRIIMLVYNTLSHAKPEYLASLLEVREIPKDLRSSSSIQLLLHHVNSAAGARAFRIFAVRLWNGLSVKKEDVQLMSSFRALVIHHIKRH